MSKAREDQLKEIITTRDYQGLRKFFEGTTADERSTYAKTAVAAYRKAEEVGIELIRRTAFNALLLTCGDEDVPDNLKFGYVTDHTFDFKLIKPLKTSLSQKIFEMLVEQQRIGCSTIARLVDEGFIQNIDSETFILNIMGALPRSVSNDYAIDLKSFGSKNSFFEHYVWRLFEVEGSGEVSLAAHDKFSAPDATWNHCLLEAERNGLVPRERLLDASLDALDRGFSQFRAGWHSRFHEDLKPTREERFQRIDKYAQLLGSTIPPTVTFAINALSETDKEYPLPPDLLARAVEPVLVAKTKTTALAALKLIDSAIVRNPNSRINLCSVASNALLHESPEVQKHAVQLFDKHNLVIEEPLRTHIMQYMDAVSPSVRKSLDKLLSRGAERNRAVTRSTLARYAYSSEPRPNPLDVASALSPIETVDELIASCTYLLEHLYDAIELERIYDGAIRLCDALPADFQSRCAPLRKRIIALQTRNEYNRDILALVNFFARWFAGETKEFLSPLSAMSELIVRRYSNILEQVEAKNTLPLLSIPTQRNGFIEPNALAERWNAWITAGKSPSPEDQAIALLRLPLGHFDFSDEKRFPGDFWNAVRYAVGNSNAHSIKTGNSSLAWRAAEAFKTPPPVAASFRIEDAPLFVGIQQTALVRSALCYFPSVRNIFVATGIRNLGSSIDGCEDAEHLSVFLEPLTDPSFELDRRVYCVLSAAILSQSPSAAGIARDVAILQISLQKLDVSMFASEVRKLLFHPAAKVKRLVEAFSDIARVSPLHADAVRQVIEASLTGGEHIPKSFSLLLEFFNELLHAEGIKVTNAATRVFLESLAQGGKTKKLAAELLAH